MAEKADPRQFNDSAHQAYDRGDFREAAKLARAMRDSENAGERSLGEDVLARLKPDPAIVALTAGCALLFVLILALAR